MFPNVSGHPSSPGRTNRNVLDRFEKEVNDNIQLIGFLRRENDQLRNTVFILKETQKSTGHLINQNNVLTSQMKEERDQLRDDLKKERERNSRDISEQDQLRVEIQSLRDELKKTNLEVEVYRKQQQQHKSPAQFQSPTNADNGKQQQNIDANNTELVTKVNQIRKRRYENLSRKFVFAADYWVACPDFLSSDNVEYISDYKINLNVLIHNISSYQEQMLIITFWRYINATSGSADKYAQVLSLCQEWKRLNPDGEIHFLYKSAKEASPSEPSKELVSLLTSCNKYHISAYDSSSDVTAIRRYWPQFADLIFDDDVKHVYPEY